MTTEHEAIIKAISFQVRASMPWVSSWKKYKDAGSVRCAAFALGRVSGMVEFANSQGVELPDILQSEVDALGEIHRQL